MFIKRIANLAKSTIKPWIILGSGLIFSLLSGIPGTGNYDIDRWLPYIYAITNSLGIVFIILGITLVLQNYDLKHGRNSLDYEERLRHRYIPFMLALVAICLGTSVLPNNSTVSSKVTKMEPGVVYVTYSPKCKFCQKAEPARKDAVNLYNNTHKTQVKTINIDENTKLVKDIKKHLKYKGMFIVQTDKNKRLITTTKPYTTGIKKNGKVTPAEPSHKATYESLVQFVKNNK